MKVKKIVNILRNEGVVILPSDTCYLLAARADSQAAINKVLELKPTLFGKPISVVMSDWKMANKYVDIEKEKFELAKKLLPGPYTLVANVKENLANGVVSEDGTLGFRITTNKTLQQIVKLIGGPVTATSAQISTKYIPYSLGGLSRLSQKKRQLIDFVLDTGRLPKRNLSTVVNLAKQNISILRRDDFLKRFDKKIQKIRSKSEEDTGEVAKKVWAEIQKVDRLVVIFLVGDLGGGKTTFVKALGKLAGVMEIINSPTFGLVNEYQADKKKLVHMDLYRLETVQEVEAMNFGQYLKPKDLVAIEWAERIPPWILDEIQTKAHTLLVETKYIDEKTREVVIKTKLPTATSSSASRGSTPKATKAVA